MLAAPVSAEAPTPQQIRRFLADYGACIVKREPELAAAAVTGDLDFSRGSPEGKRLMQRECVDANELANTNAGFVGKLRMGDNFMRGAIADALFARDAARLTATDFSGVPALVNAEPWPVRLKDRNGSDLPADAIARQQKRFDEKMADLQRNRMAECVARAAGPQVRAMLGTPIDTPAELDALKAVAPAIGPCVPAGITAGFDRMTLRGALSIAYVRLASAAKVAG
jgi:hypothetical protein